MKPHIVVIGSLNMDLVTETDRVPSQGETVIGRRFSQFNGGKGANQAVSACRLGAKVSMIGAVGSDVYGQQLKQGLANEGILVENVETVTGVSSGIAQITLSEGDNSIIVIPGANYECTPEWIEQNKEVIINADLVMLQLEIPLDSVYKACEIAHRNSVPVMLNPAPAQPLSRELLEKVTYLTPNRSELATLTSTQLTTERDFEEAVNRLWEYGVEQVVITSGEQGAFHAKNSDPSISYSKSYSVDVVDTTGAGDAFNGALAVSLAEGQSLEESVRFAVAVGAIAVTKHGAQSGMPTREEVERFLSKQVK